MIASFTYDINPGRILFGPGTLNAVADEIERLGAKRALILSTPFQHADAQKLATQIGSLAAGIFSEAIMHTPVAVTLKAMAAFEAFGADCLIALGGGSTIGLGKAIALRNDAPQIVVATTYAGSEVTPILGHPRRQTSCRVV
jgi:maleylacetate reductase